MSKGWRRSKARTLYSLGAELFMRRPIFGIDICIAWCGRDQCISVCMFLVASYGELGWKILHEPVNREISSELVGASKQECCCQS